MAGHLQMHVVRRRRSHLGLLLIYVALVEDTVIDAKDYMVSRLLNSYI